MAGRSPGPAELRLETLVLPTAPLGDLDPLPPLRAVRDLHDVGVGEDLDDEMRHGLAHGRLPTVLPHLLQNGYGRTREPREHRVAVLENEALRATFLLGVGGRLWSLVHRPSERELLHRNAVLQPANLGLRNAWVAGGVEWNIGTIGHTPTTLSPLHASRVLRPDGQPVLRLHEYDRLRGVVFALDAWLADDVPLLHVRVRVVNPADHEVPMYWWSNAAVPQGPDVRVLAPADAAWQFGDHQGLRRVPVPVSDGVDRSYPSRSTHAADWFFDVAEREQGRPWVAALDGSGRGLFQASTAALRGRKLFVWGTGRGGEHWQEWLSGPGQGYLEIQAGLARTQLEHVPMPAGAVWDWVEAYGMLECDPALVLGEDWAAARAHACARLDALAPRDRLEDTLAEARHWSDLAPVEVLQHGSGWGALEHRARRAAGLSGLDAPGTPFPDETLGPEQDPWLDLLAGAAALPGDPSRPPVSYQTSALWRRLLDGVPGWHAALQRGVAASAAGDLDAAEREWHASLADRPTVWARRTLGALARARGEDEAALEHYRDATATDPGPVTLTLELVELLLALGRPDEVLVELDRLPAARRAHGRVRFAEARAALAAGDLDRVGTIVDAGLVIADVREGEESLTDFWSAYQEALAERALRRGEAARRPDPLPRDLDFSMRPDPG